MGKMKEFHMEKVETMYEDLALEASLYQVAFEEIITAHRYDTEVELAEYANSLLEDNGMFFTETEIKEMVSETMGDEYGILNLQYKKGKAL